MYKTAAVAVVWLAFGGSPVASAQDAPAPDTVFSQPDRQLQVSGRLEIRQKTVYLPVTQVKWMIHGKFTARRRVQVRQLVQGSQQRRRRGARAHDHADPARRSDGAVRRCRLDDADPPGHGRRRTRLQGGCSQPRGRLSDQVTSGKLKIGHGVFVPDGMPTLTVSGMTSPAGMAGLQGWARSRAWRR